MVTSTSVKREHAGEGDWEELPSEITTPSLENVPETPQSPEKTQLKSTTTGSRCTIQTLYEGSPKCKCCKNWVEEYPDDLRRTVEEEAETKQNALVKRMSRDHGNGKALILDSIVVQSMSLKKTLKEVFDGYVGITTSSKDLIFKSPFHPFYYRWARFTEILERQKREDPNAAIYSVLLYDELKRELSDVMIEIEEQIPQGVIAYQHLWALFEPGRRIMATEGSQERFYIVSSYFYNFEVHSLSIDVKFVDWDGESFGYADDTITIYEYDGTKTITSLNAFPADFLPEKTDTEAKAISRGRKFQDLREIKYMAYSGLVRSHDFLGRDIEQKVDGRIVVDATSFFFENPTERRRLGALDAESIAPRVDVADIMHIDDDDDYSSGEDRPIINYNPRVPHRSRRRDRRRRRRVIDPPHPVERTSEPVLDLTDEQLMLCNIRVKGYALMLKRWGMFDVDGISDIIWNEEAFERLILPRGFKNLILSFVEGQTSSDYTFDDIIEGKGLGIIMLLIGTPGTGKTLTAEAVAEKVQRPLYVLSAGELGQNASGVESQLTNILEMTERWGAILLFDECDVFLQERSMSNMVHNEIVAVFLRLLEYHRGIMFMTSNRADMIDQAFQSRIHLTLHYPELDLAAKEHIWRQFTTKPEQENKLKDKDYADLAQLPMNGRQIKNVVKISKLLAHQEQAELTVDHVRTVLDATREADVKSI